MHKVTHVLAAACSGMSSFVLAFEPTRKLPTDGSSECLLPTHRWGSNPNVVVVGGAGVCWGVFHNTTAEVLALTPAGSTRSLDNIPPAASADSRRDAKACAALTAFALDVPNATTNDRDLISVATGATPYSYLVRVPDSTRSPADVLRACIPNSFQRVELLQNAVAIAESMDDHAFTPAQCRSAYSRWLRLLELAKAEAPNLVCRINFRLFLSRFREDGFGSARDYLADAWEAADGCTAEDAARLHLGEMMLLAVQVESVGKSSAFPRFQQAWRECVAALDRAHNSPAALVADVTLAHATGILSLHPAIYGNGLAKGSRSLTDTEGMTEVVVQLEKIMHESERDPLRAGRACALLIAVSRLYPGYGSAPALFNKGESLLAGLPQDTSVRLVRVGLCSNFANWLMETDSESPSTADLVFAERCLERCRRLADRALGFVPIRKAAILRSSLARASSHEGLHAAAFWRMWQAGVIGEDMGLESRLAPAEKKIIARFEQDIQDRVCEPGEWWWLEAISMSRFMLR